MRLCFIGASAFGLRCLAAARATTSCTVVGAVTAPRTFPISYRPQGVTNVLYADVAGYCRDHGIDAAVIEQGMKDPQLLERVRLWAPDAFLVVGWYHLVPAAWRALAPAYGLHASLLPDYSGGAPLVWAMINGERRTGITLFQLADGVDDGPIVGQAATEITPEDTIASLYARIETLGLGLLEEHLPRLAAGGAVLHKQDEARRRVFPQRGPEDGKIDWNAPSHRVHDFIRAQTRPYPGAFTLWRDAKVSIWSSRDCGRLDFGLAPGEFRRTDAGLIVGCGSNTALALVEISIDGVDVTPEEWWKNQ